MTKQQQISVFIPQEKEGYYHLMHPAGGNTLCGWIDVPHTEHSIYDHPVTCPNCKAIVSFCKQCSGPWDEPKERQAKHIFLVCGNHDEYLAYLREHKLPRSAVTYVHEENQLRGFHADEDEIVLYGQWWKNRIENTGALEYYIKRYNQEEK